MARKKPPSPLRFLIPLLQFTGPAIAAMIVIKFMVGVSCDASRGIAKNDALQCGHLPPSTWYVLIGIALLGIVGSGWRWYRDYVKHDLARDTDF